MYAGCAAGAIQRETYLELIKANGFTSSSSIIQKNKLIIVTDDVLSQYLSEEEELQEFKQSGTGITSLTVYADKPATGNKACLVTVIVMVNIL